MRGGGGSRRQVCKCKQVQVQGCVHFCSRSRSRLWDKTLRVAMQVAVG